VIFLLFIIFLLWKCG